MASGDHSIIATSFPKFASLPEEIRRLIWEQACFPARIHFLEFPRVCTLPPVGYLVGPAAAPHYQYAGVRDDLAKLIANAENYPQKWSVPGRLKFCHHYSPRDLNRISEVCYEARDVYLSLVNGKQRQSRLKKGVKVSESFDIFHFSSTDCNRFNTRFLLNMRPRLCPTKLVIHVDVDRLSQQRNFEFSKDGKTATLNFPNWLWNAIQWGREAKEGYNNSRTTTLTPSIDNVVIDLQNLEAVYLIDYKIKLRRSIKPGSTASGSGSKRPSSHQYNSLFHGMHCDFYALSPGNEEIMKHWDVPAYLWPALTRMKRLIRSSGDWKVNLYLMTSVGKKTPELADLRGGSTLHFGTRMNTEQNECQRG